MKSTRMCLTPHLSFTRTHSENNQGDLSSIMTTNSFSKPKMLIGHYPNSWNIPVMVFSGIQVLFMFWFGVGILSKRELLGFEAYIVAGLSFAMPLVALGFVTSRVAIYEDKIALRSFAIGNSRFPYFEIPLSSLRSVYISADALGSYSIVFESETTTRIFSKCFGNRQLHAFLTVLSECVAKGVLKKETKIWLAQYDRRRK